MVPIDGRPTAITKKARLIGEPVRLFDMKFSPDEHYFVAGHGDSFEAYDLKERAEKLFGLAEVIVAKQRHGSTGQVPLTFHKNITKFADRADDAYRPEPYGD